MASALLLASRAFTMKYLQSQSRQAPILKVSATCCAAEAGRGDAVDLATVGPLRLVVVSVEPAKAGLVSVLAEVVAECGGPSNTRGLSTVDGWPVRCA